MSYKDDSEEEQVDARASSEGDEVGKAVELKKRTGLSPLLLVQHRRVANSPPSNSST
jgi:hypothetical protein